jgi:ribose-phosphate pyrophosphokinase
MGAGVTQPLLFSMPGNEALAVQLGKKLSWELGWLQSRKFPDGEVNLRLLTSVDKRDVAFICTLNHPDEKFLSLYLAASVARELGASQIGFIVPYLPYMRQDARFHEGEGITSLHFARLLSSCCDWLVTVDPHLHRYHELGEIYSIPTNVAHATSAIAAWIRQNVAQPFLIGPDAESEQWVAEIAGAAGCPYMILKKLRHGDRLVEVSVPDVERLDKMTPILIDDIVSTGRTMVAAASHLRAAGLAPPVCIAIHPIFAGDAYDVLASAGIQRIVSCNTITHSTNNIDLSESLANSISEIIVRN